MPSLPNIVAIGAGNIASHFIPALHNIGCNITQVFSRKVYKARSLAHKVNGDGIDNLSDIDCNADMYLIMVSDDAIKTVINSIPELENNPIVCHTSGATETSLLKKLSPNFGAFYALQSFKKDQPLKMDALPFLLNASNSETLRTLRVLARQISSHVEDCSDEERLIYHLAAVYVNNFTNHMACIADNILNESNLNPEVLKPIMESTFENIIKSNPCEIQTGPAIRQDILLQRQHLKLIKNKENWSKIYKVVSDSITQSIKNNESS